MQINFRTKIILLLIGALGVAQATTLVIVLMRTYGNVIAAATDELAVAESVFDSLLGRDFQRIADQVRVVSADWGLRQSYGTGDIATLRSTLVNHGDRTGAQMAVLVDLNGQIVAGTGETTMLQDETGWAALVDEVSRDDYVESTSALLGDLYQVVGVPINAPDRIAWLFMAFSVNDELASEFKDITGLDITFFASTPGSTARSASTLPESRRNELYAGIDGLRDDGESVHELRLRDERYLTMVKALGVGAEPVSAVLQKSLTQAMAPFKDLRLEVLQIFLVVLTIAILVGARFASTITLPVRRLAAAAVRIGEGNYGTRIEIDTHDEIARLGETLNTMQSEIAEREYRIVHQAHHDDLTGLPNRWLAKDRLEGAIQRSSRNKRAFTVVMMDIDRFKQINDSLGHHVGDLVLQETARRLVARMRRSDCVARLGGDDFFLILEGCDILQSTAIIEDVTRNLAAPIDLDGMQVRLDFSIGLVEFPSHASNSTEILRRSEIAMYDAKEAHHGVVVYEPGRDETQIRQLAIVGDFPRALKTDQLTLHFQPKARLEDGTIESVEALVRWTHPTFGFLPPDEFVAVIEQSGNIMKLTEWVIEKSMRQCRDWLDRDIDVRVSVNLSTLDLLNEQLPAVVARNLASRGLSADRLCLEITESAVMRDPARARNILRQLQLAGIRTSIDDFGTGYSSLAQLKSLPVNELKIDKSFVINLSSNSDDAIIVQSTIELAHAMKLGVVAEGVETKDAWMMLKGFGCDHAQGYLISRPLPAEQFERWYKSTQKEVGGFLINAA